MPFNGSGVYSLPAGQPVATGTVIDSTVFNALTSDLATALTNCLTRDGQSPATGNIPFGANRITGVAAGIASTDGVNLTQVQALIQNGTLQLLTSVAGTNTITATATGPIAAYAAGQFFLFVAANTITGAATININGLGAQAITKTGATALISADIISGAAYVIFYDGTRFQLVNAPAAQNGASLSLLTVATSAGAQSVMDFLLPLSNYDEFVFEIDGWQPNTAGSAFWMRSSADGITYNTANYQWVRNNIAVTPANTADGSASDSKMVLANDVGAGKACGAVKVRSLSGLGVRYESTLSCVTNAGLFYRADGAGYYGAAADQYIRFTNSAGTITNGVVIRLYGIKKS